MSQWKVTVVDSESQRYVGFAVVMAASGDAARETAI